MKPLKSLSGIANWLLRIAVALFMFSAFWNTIINISFSSFSWHLLLVILYVLCGIMLLIGGFRSNNSWTIIAGIGIALLSCYFAYFAYNGSWFNAAMSVYIFPFAIGLYFAANGK